MSTDLITEARELCEKATPGPWTYDGMHNEIHCLEEYFLIVSELRESPAEQLLDKFGHTYNPNFAFIARSRTLIPELCDAMEKAQAEIEKMKPFYKIADDTFRHWENAAYAMRDDERKRHRWIPISERFPMPVDLNQQGFVLGLFDNGDVDFCGGKEAQHITTLTHWMPLPEPPEDKP